MTPGEDSTVPTADDPVCLLNGDLACVRVEAAPSTPHADYGGRTYYFCSDACRTAFEKEPERYVSAVPRR